MVVMFGIGVLAALVGLAATSDWKSLLGLSLAGFWFLVAGLVLYRREKQQVDGHWWGRILVAGLLVRLPAAFLHLAVAFWFYRGETDFLEYHRAGGTMVQQWLEGKVDSVSDSLLPLWGFIYVHVTPAKTELRLMEHLTGLSNFLVGPGLVGMVILFALVGFIGCYLFLRAFRLEFPYGKDTRFLALGLFFLPSLAFWGSYPGKDAWMLLFLGCVSYSFSSLLKRFHVGHLLGIVASLMGIALLRGPLAGILVLTMGASWLLKRWKGPAAILRPTTFIVYPFAVVVVFMYIGSSLLPGS
ncbi:MAG: hypothetical protein ACE5JO_06300, partial [Candidatus Binatia bacterium]